jgi:hypothetical protein
VYSFTYTEMPKAFFMPHQEQWSQQAASLTTRFKGTADLCHSYSKGITKATILCKVIAGSQWYPRSLFAHNNGLSLHCCNNVFQQKLFPLLQQCISTMTCSHCCITDFQQWSETGRHGQAHKVFFTYARAWRTPNNIISVWMPLMLQMQCASCKMTCSF